MISSCTSPKRSFWDFRARVSSLQFETQTSCHCFAAYILKADFPSFPGIAFLQIFFTTSLKSETLSLFSGYLSKAREFVFVCLAELIFKQLDFADVNRSLGHWVTRHSGVAGW